ncbi:50S ribosomal protein L17 [Patescibacteria group bacterium]|nr:50S ribosomal protein L17 [Patescibacteria group bacterium]
MRHRVKKSFFNRDTKHRQAMLKNSLRNLVLHGEIKTTHAKAKEFKRLADKLIARALTDSVESRRKLHQVFGKRDIVNTLVDRIAPVFKDRKSGFTRIIKIGRRRGDNVEMVKLELVVKPEILGTLKKSIEVKPAQVKKNVTLKKTKSVAKKVKTSKITKEEKIISKKKDKQK